MNIAQASFSFDIQGNRKYLNQVEWRAFLDAASSAPPEVRVFCFVLAYTGARISEVLALSPARIDFDEKVIVFESLKKRQRGLYRRVPVPTELLQTLDAVYSVRCRQKRSSSTHKTLWTWCRTTAWTRVKEVMQHAGISGVKATPKGLRHSFGVLAIQAGIPLNMLQKWLGHTHMHTTAIYANALGPEERGFASKLWRGFSGKKENTSC
ncbi:tyrosine-type recombinase/integrase [Kordiimonas pumila]|uniref:Tyrosine-type recombinase/integrase n=1 Tax=Kordiimonas pumila TaxID=2161677 RepID=A0ABV7D9J1_9PROT|nr:site-specific integrase [Kordiimonas pumila]